MALGQAFKESSIESGGAHYGADLEQAAEDYHIEDLGIVHLSRLVHSVDAIDSDVAALGRIHNAIAVVDEDAARLDLRFKLVERGLVEHDGYVVMAEYGRGDALVAHYDGHVGRAASLLGSVGRHPRHFLFFHKA